MNFPHKYYDIFWYSAIADLTFSDLYGHISTENCLYLPKALINWLKHGTKIKVWLKQTSLKSIGDSIQSYNHFY